MTVTPTTLRALFPEFGNVTTYPDPVIQARIDITVLMVNADRWGELTDYGVSLATAHHLSLGRKAARSAAVGGAPGMSSGVMTSKSIDGVSMGFDFASVAEENGGHWNLTTYGTEYLRQARIVGAGPIQSGAPGPGGVSAYQGAWPGPYVGG